MIERIEWSHSTHFGELPSPFMRGKQERPLRITLHSDSLAKLSGQEMAAVALLRELGHLPEIEVLETKPSSFPHIEVGATDLKADIIPVQSVSDGVPQTFTSIPFPHQWPVIAAQLAGQPDSDQQNARAMLELLILAQAHYLLHGDIIVTSSTLLLKHRNNTWLREANPRTPLEAAQIVGLFLRSRNNYIYRATSNTKVGLGRGLFYWVLARGRLPNMWKYLSTCRAAEKLRGDNLSELGESILVRSVRALEARDAIGVQFYMPQNNETRDQTMYHFDYLTLVLAGALDAQARVANSAYNVSFKGSRVSFRNKGFKKALHTKRAVELYDFITSQRFNDVSTLLYELRNTIHEAALKTTAYQEIGKQQHSFIMVPPGIDRPILDASERLGSADRWGLSREPFGTLLEPYSYTTALVEESLNVIDCISAATDVKLLFPSGTDIPAFSDAASKSHPFCEFERIALLA